MDIPPHHHKAQLLQVIYCSRSRITGSPEQVATMLAELLATSRRNNASDWISGVLLYNGTAFAQVLEGPAHAVESCVTRIQQDSRHTNVVIVSRNTIQRRVFSSWSMAYLDGTSVRLLSESAIDLEAILATGKSEPGFVLNLLREVMGTQGYA